MKRAFLWAFLTWLGVVLASLVICLVLPVPVDAERVGDIGSRIGLFLAFVVFVIFWIRRANRKETKSPLTPPQSTPENLQPIDYSKLSQLYDDDQRA